MNRASLLILLLFASSAVPQDFKLEASLGLIDLVSGFEDDPLVIPIAAGGQENAGEFSSDCYGLVADRPDASINYSSREFELNFAVLSEIDTTLVINTPSGKWVCNDDYNLVNPGISFDYPQSGQYDIWIGVYAGNDELDMSQLLVSETDMDELFGLYENFCQDNGEITKRFLENNNIPHEVAKSETDTMLLSEVASRAQEYTGILLCF